MGILVAPVDATVAAVNGAVGQSVGSGGGSGSSSGGSTGSSASQGFIVLTDTGKLTIQALVNEADIASVQQGQPAQFTVAAYTSSTFRASVSAIDTIGVASSNVVSYTVLLTIDQSSITNNEHLYPGMTATASITTAQRIGTLLIPSAALTYPTIALQAGLVDRTALRSLLGGGQSGQGQSTTSSKSRVVLKLQNGKLVPVVITTGLSSGQYTEVLSGLNPGDQVVVGQTGGSTSTTTGTGTGAGRGAGGIWRWSWRIWWRWWFGGIAGGGAGRGAGAGG